MKSKYFILFFGFLAFGQINAQVSETRSLSSFSSVSVGESINVELVKGSQEEALVEVRGADLSDVLTDISGDRLRIRMDGNRNFRNVTVNIRLTYVSIDEIDVSSSADLISKGPLVSEDLDIEVSSSGDAILEIEVTNLNIKVSSSGDLDLSGSATYQRVEVSSSGDYNAYDLESEEAELDVSSAGDAYVNVSRRIDAKASSAGSVVYKGNPDKVYGDSSSSGKVRKY